MEVLKVYKGVGRTRIFLFGKKFVSFPNRYARRIQSDIYKNYIEKYKNTPREIILFDCLYDKYAEAIDAFTLFKYLQNQGIASKYFLLKENKLSKSSEIELYKDNIILIDTPDDIFFRYSDEIAKSKYIITSFGLASVCNKLLRGLPFLKSIFIDHGVMFFKDWVVSLYNPEKFDLILCPSRRTEKFYLEKKIWSKESLLYSGIPRWDNLKKIPHEKKRILIFFTWRKSFKHSKLNRKQYMNCLQAFVSNEKLQSLLKQYNVEINLCVHHTIYACRFLFNIDNINILDSYEISKEILKTDLLITDYSSVCFDFMYLDVPVIFYRFDSNVVYKNRDDRRALKSCREKDKYLYNCFYQGEVDKVIDKIEHYIKNGFELESENIEKNKQFFYHRDNKNCERLLTYLTENEH